MDQRLCNLYYTRLDYVEDPLIEIMQGLWSLPFVVNTLGSCCGHIIANNTILIGRSAEEWERISRLDSPLAKRWYLHQAELGIEYSLDSSLVSERSIFAESLRKVRVADGETIIYLDGGIKHYSGSFVNPNLPVIQENYWAVIPNGSMTEEYVLKVERLLTEFWSKVAGVIRKHNPKVDFSSRERDYRRIINWANWNIPKDLEMALTQN